MKASFLDSCTLIVVDVDRRFSRSHVDAAENELFLQAGGAWRWKLRKGNKYVRWTGHINFTNLATVIFYVFVPFAHDQLDRALSLDLYGSLGQLQQENATHKPLCKI